MITSYMYTNVGGRKVNEDSCITLEDDAQFYKNILSEIDNFGYKGE